MRKEAEDDGNIILCIVLRIIECMIDCAGDIIEGITEWAYIQCAVRGVGFCDACWATFAVWVHSSVDAVVAALLIDLVPFLGAILIGALSAIVGFVVFHARVAMEGWSASVFCFCFFMGFGCAIAALMPLKSGSTTIIICYAEEKDFLRRKAPALYEALCQAQLEYDRDSSVASASSSRRGSHQNQQGQQARDVRAAPLMEMQAAEIDSLHEEALRAAADLKQGNTKEGQELLIGLAQDGTIDPQLLHTFGDFLDLHLLPLYVRDMPLESLRETLLHYCGISLDEEDEIKARQVLGCPPRQKSRKKLGKNISDTSMPGTPSSQGSAMELSLRQILQASGQERKLRDQMLNSVVEKRRFGLSAHPDLKIPRDVASPALAHKRKAAGPCTPDKKTKKGRLLETTTTAQRISRAFTASLDGSPDRGPPPGTVVKWNRHESPPPSSVVRRLTAEWSADVP
eukprot:symbB.v1.2.003968.t1/scaffold170.1/size288889/14